MKASFKILLIFLLVNYNVKAQLQEDDVLHFGAGILSGAAGGLIASEITNGNRFWTFAGAVGGSILAGSIKEAIDEKKYNGWDNRDLGATILGGITAGITIDLLTSKRRKRKNKAYEETWNSIE